MATRAAALAAPTPLRWARRHNDVLLALATGGVLALMMLRLPMDAALVTTVVGAFVILALVDTRVALLGLLLVRSIT